MRILQVLRNDGDMVAIIGIAFLLDIVATVLILTK
jgi:hypothetical protein